VHEEGIKASTPLDVACLRHPYYCMGDSRGMFVHGTLKVPCVLSFVNMWGFGTMRPYSPWTPNARLKRDHDRIRNITPNYMDSFYPEN